MANTACKGFSPLRRLGGGSITYKRGRVLTNNTTAIFKGDAVVITATGDYVAQSTGTTFTASVAWGALYQSATTGQMIAGKYLPAATLYTSTGVAPANMSQIYVVEDPIDTLFEASVTQAIALTDLNLNFAITLTAGSTTTGLSGHVLTSAGANTTATIPWRVRDFIIRADVDPDLANAHVECQVNAGMTEPAISLLVGT